MTTSHIVRARVGSEITIRIEDLPPGAIEPIRSSLSFENEERRKNQALNIMGWWDLPEVVVMWREETTRAGDHNLVLPRGYATQLVAGLAASGHGVDWVDERARVSSKTGYFRPFDLRDYQMWAVRDMLAAEQGVYKAPAGSGKTVTMLGLMTYLQQRTVVITDKSFLLEQWRERAVRFLDLSLDMGDERSIGKIGENVWEERDLTIALRQTLSSRLWEIKTGWADRVGLLIIEECHHLSGESLQEIVRVFPSAWIFGISATPARTAMQGRVTSVLVGPIVAETSRQLLYDRGVLVRPVLREVRTDLQAVFWRDHSSVDGVCEVPDCRKAGSQHSHRNNYSSCLKKLVEDRARNDLVGRTIARERGHVHLVYSRQLKHLELIAKAAAKAGWDGPVYRIRGEENASGDSQNIARAIIAGGFWKLDEEKSRPAVRARGGEPAVPAVIVWKQTSAPVDGVREALVLSTVADEGMDIPPIDRVHMVFPGRQQAATIQIVGRGERVAEGKTEVVVVDYHDHLTDVFDEQYAERLRTYRAQGIDPEPLRREQMIGFHVDQELGEVRYSCPCGGMWSEPYDCLDQPAAEPTCCSSCRQTIMSIEDLE